jgi:hypothetical protein
VRPAASAVVLDVGKQRSNHPYFMDDQRVAASSYVARTGTSEIQSPLKMGCFDADYTEYCTGLTLRTA